MLLYRTQDTVIAVRDDQAHALQDFSFDALFTAADPAAYAAAIFSQSGPGSIPGTAEPLRPPMGNQEVWAAGVTYQRSRAARMDESKDAGASIFYDRVYDAPRPELFFKATAGRTRGHLAPLRVRSDSAWSVPEPELTLAINSEGRIFGFTAGNDMSSRDIEGDNPLYLPQAKTYRGSCALGPALLIADTLAEGTSIHLMISRGGEQAFAGSIPLTQLKRTFPELAGWLFRDNEFPAGALLLTGTGIVPPGKWTLQSGDRVSISIDSIGMLENYIE